MNRKTPDNTLTSLAFGVFKKKRPPSTKKSAVNGNVLLDAVRNINAMQSKVQDIRIYIPNDFLKRKSENGNVNTSATRRLVWPARALILRVVW